MLYKNNYLYGPGPLRGLIGAAVLFFGGFPGLFCPAVFAQEGEGAYRLEDITVTGTRTEKRLKDSPVLTELITAEEIENSSAATVTELLEDYGIMYTGGPMGDSVQLQGMGEGRVLYLIDGKRVSGRINQRLDGDTMPIANVERIEIVRGPQSALYGSDGIGGVINIITKKPGGKGGKLSLSANLSNSFLLAYDDPGTSYKPEDPFTGFAPLREQHFNGSVGFPIALSQNLITLEGSRGGFYHNEDKSASVLPEYYRGKAGLDTSFPLGDSAGMSLGASFMGMRSDEQTSALGSLTRRDYIRAGGYIQAELAPWSGNLTLRIYDNYYQRDMDTYWAGKDEWTTGENHEYENLAALEVIGSYDGIDHFIFTAGFEGAYNSMDKYNLRNHGSTFVWTDREALYAQAEYFKEDKYSFILGARGERSSQFGFGGAPKLSAMIHLPAGFRLLGGAGLGYRAPGFSDLYMAMDETIVSGHPTIMGNEDLKPEYALSFNLALEYAKDDFFFAQINGYYTELWNEITNVLQNYKTAAGRDVYLNENILRSLRTGFDTEARLTLFKSAFISAAYSWLYAYDRSEGKELYPQPAHMVRGKIGWDYKGAGIYTYLQGRFFSPLDPGDPSYDPRFILDFYFALTFAKHFTVYASVDNITGLIDPLGPATAQEFTAGLKFVL
ncbi:MAG: TonB-dependent receptor [Spirochaetaceae bacterium]|jgi:outer membrane receptor for ferrienterochelin and colicins|nr:TonB-dependent receptor [Spirochaetaceae bacterium]